MTKIKRFLCLFFLLLISTFATAQENFVLDNHHNKAVIPFKFINNLIFIPIKVNGVELNFLLDSGVEETILFSLEETTEVSFINPQKIMLKGLGSEQSIEGLKSTDNRLETHGMLSKNHLVYIILDQSFNLSSHVGIPVNGIVGYQFFKDNIVVIDYKKKKLTVYDKIEKIKASKLRKFSSIPLSIERSKPYIITNLKINGIQKKSKLLIDIGNSDAVWLFQSDTVALPTKKVEDFLGKGFSGDILGHRAKIDNFSIADFVFEKPIAAFPDSTSVRNVKMVANRVGSVGGEVLSRFTTILDYQNQRLYLKKNGNYKKPFQYNHSGITIQHNGLQWIQETVSLHTPTPVYTSEGETKKQTTDFKFEFKLKPVFEIANIRKNSAAEKAGLKQGDVLLSINDNAIHKFSLQQINELLKSDGGKFLSLKIERKEKILNFKFKLENEL